MAGFFDWLAPIGDIFSGKTDILTGLSRVSPQIAVGVEAVRALGSGISSVTGVEPSYAPSPRTLSGAHRQVRPLPPIRGSANGGRTRAELERGRALATIPGRQYSIGVTTPGGYSIGGAITRAGAGELVQTYDRYGRPRGGQYVMAQRRVTEWPMRVFPRRMNPLNRRAGRRAIRRVRSMKRLMSKLMSLMPSRGYRGGRVSHVPRGYRHVRRRGDLDPFYLEDQLDVRDELADLEDEELEIPFED